MTDPVLPASPPAPPAVPVRGGRWLRIALAVSVALNLAVAGVVGGAVLKARGGDPRPVAVRDLSFGAFTDALSREDRAALRRAFGDRGPGLRDMRGAMRADLVDVLAALRADPFDPATLAVVLHRQQARMTERFELGQTLMLDLLTGMDPARRAAFADRLEERLGRDARRRPEGREADGE